ncbi:MAG: hypothetical protein KAS98_11355, partial [Deltaproteobacteria bacterium]|nr:hypothetical protein [Deltaproteobacteria bacterium]
EFIPLGETVAWNWQQGAMLQWLNDAPGKIIYNDRQGDDFVARIMDVNTGEKQTICRPIYCLSPDGNYALSVNFALLDKERPGYGYRDVKNPWEGIDHTDEDGIWLVDLKKNSARLLISYDQVIKQFYLPTMDNVSNWFNHLLFSPDSERFAFFHRWRTEKSAIEGAVYAPHLTRMYTAGIHDSSLYPLNLDDMSSHYTWVNDKRIINYSRQFGQGDHYYLYTDQTDQVEVIGEELFDVDGHCSFSLDQKWMLTDNYPTQDNKGICGLYLMDIVKNTRYEIGSFQADPSLPTPTRCDLHPNWSRDCRRVCIDSMHEGFRGIYVIDVSELIDS